MTVVAAMSVRRFWAATHSAVLRIGGGARHASLSEEEDEYERTSTRGHATLSDMEDKEICGGGIHLSTRGGHARRRFLTSTHLDDIDAEEAGPG